jgi:hypothetical protein
MNMPDRNSKPATIKTVLILDGEVLVRMPVVEYLRECGCRVIEAATTDEAIAILQKTNIPVDVVLSDIDIPGMERKKPGPKRKVPFVFEGKRMLFLGHVAVVTKMRDNWHVNIFEEGQREDQPKFTFVKYTKEEAAYSITSSAMASKVGGISRPRALAVLRLMISSNLVGCNTGRSAGFVPCKMRPA